MSNFFRTHFGGRSAPSTPTTPATGTGTTGTTGASQTPQQPSQSFALGRLAPRNNNATSQARPRAAPPTRTAGGQAAPLQAQTPPQRNPAVDHSLNQARDAHAEVPVRADRQAQANAVESARNSSIQDLQQRHTGADAEVTTLLTARRQTATDAATAESTANGRRAQRQRDFDDHDRQFRAADGATAGLVAARDAAQNDPAYTAAVQARALADTALTRAQQAAANPPPPAAPAAPGAPANPPPPTAAQLQADVQRAQADLRRADATLLPLQQALDNAQTDVDNNTRALATHRDGREAARGPLADATAAHVAAQQVRTAADRAVTVLETAQQQASDALHTHLAPMTAHRNAATTAATTAATATDAHRTLATLTAEVATTTERAHQADETLTTRRNEQATAQAAVVGLEGRLDPQGPLQRAVREADQLVRSLETSLNRAGQPGPSTGPQVNVPELTSRLLVARETLRTAREPVTRLEGELDLARQTLTAADRALQTATTASQTAHDARTDAVTARTTHHTQVAVPADAAAAHAVTVRDGLHAAAETSKVALDQAVTQLCETMRPAPATPPADDRSAVKKSADGVGRAVEALKNRTGPAKLDFSTLNFSGSTNGGVPTRFRDSPPPANAVTTATSPSQLKAVDKKVKTATAAAANLLSGGDVSTKQAARMPDAFSNAVAFTTEVSRKFTAHTAGTDGAPTAAQATEATPAATRLAQGLLEHPRSNAASRPDGHPLRHDEALLIASVLRSVTQDPAQAAAVYNHIWNSPPPALSNVTPRAAGTPSPLAEPGAEATAPSTDPDILRMANTARRALAATSGGMEALLAMQGLSLPAAGHADRPHAEHAVEHYKLSLRAEDALVKLLGVGGAQSTADIRAATHTPEAGQARMLDASYLGTGNARRDGMARRQAEHRATLPAQALEFALANMNRGPGVAESAPAMKPAYVALRNGFTESGQGTDFHLMAKRLNKFNTYIDLACKTSVAGPTALDKIKDPVGTIRRKVGKDKTPLKTLMQAGPLGSNLGTVPGEHAKRLTKALDDSQTQLRGDLTTKYGALSQQDHSRGVMRLAAMQLWAEQVPAAFNPKIDLTQGTRISPEAVMARAQALNQTLAGEAGQPPRALHDATMTHEASAHLGKPLMASTLDAWFGGGKLADSSATVATPEMTALNNDVKILRGKAQLDSKLDDLQTRFDAASKEDRKDILRQVMISVVAGGDMADYSDGRKNGIGGMFGYLAAQVDGIGGVSTGVTPVGEFNVDHTRTAILRAGVASNTGVIYLGNETKVTEMLGVGVRAGAALGPVGVTGQVMGRLGGSHLFSEGLMIRTNKQGKEHESLPDAVKQGTQSDNWKQMSEMVVNSVFEISQQPAAQRPKNGGEMWREMVGRVGDYRDISFGWNAGQNHQINGSISADGMLGGPVGLGSASVTGNIGLKHTFLNRGKARDTGGATQAVQASSGSRTSLGMGATAGISHPTLKNHDHPDVGLFTRHKVGIETDMVLQAKNGFVRITTEDGKVKPNISYKHREFGTQDAFFKLVNSQPEWAARLGERGPDGALRGGEEMLQGFLQQTANLPAGNNRLFIERKCLTQDAADAINACMEQLAVIERPLAPGTTPDPDAAAQIRSLQKQIAAHVSDEGSWQPFRLFVNETNQRVKEQSSTGGEIRATPNKVDDKEAGPTGMAERFLGGGKVTIGGKINSAHGGRDLITIDAMPVRA
ncbi:hypothetical protein [Roseateles sp.]|uniref:hypothetical protein n=1 Tax=Roseateles sp. TaxID=1971397 RepID=UPI002F406D03